MVKTLAEKRHTEKRQKGRRGQRGRYSMNLDSQEGARPLRATQNVSKILIFIIKAVRSKVF